MQNLEISDPNYEIAWDLLKTRFENKNAIINQHIKLILDIPILQKESLTCLRNLHDVSLKNIKSIVALHEDAKSWDLILVHILATKLDTATRKEWETKSQNLENTTLDEFHKFLLKKCMVLENVTPFKSDVKSDDRKYKSFKSNVVTSNSCPVCYNNHFLYQCPSFKGKPVDERLREVRRLSICQNCLRVKHALNDCKFGNYLFANIANGSIIRFFTKAFRVMRRVHRRRTAEPATWRTRHSGSLFRTRTCDGCLILYCPQLLFT